MYFNNPDLVYADDYPEPRYGPGTFQLMMESAFKATYGYEIESITYGKPNKISFEFAANCLREKARKDGVEISNYYMIGDNPKSDIDGANRLGWTSILVKTGVFDPTAPTSVNGNDKEHPATHVVDDFEEAIKLIY